MKKKIRPMTSIEKMMNDTPERKRAWHESQHRKAEVDQKMKKDQK